MAKSVSKKPKQVEAIKHDEAKRKNLPSAEMQALMEAQDQDPIKVAYERRNRDLDPQLVWRGKDEQDVADLTVDAPPLFIQEKIHPKALVDDLVAQSAKAEPEHEQFDLFSDFNGLPDGAESTEFYEHESNWSNRMILGDSLQVMASLAEREGLRGSVQCIYIDPPYGIKFNSNFQWSTQSRTVEDNKPQHITREPEQVKAFRDTWRDGIHSYLAYLRDRLLASRDLLSERGSIFVQIGDENVHRVRSLLDEVFGEENFRSLITYRTSVGLGSSGIDNVSNFLLWYSKSSDFTFNPLFSPTRPGEQGASRYKRVIQLDGSSRRATPEELHDPSMLPDGAHLYRDQGLTSRSGSEATIFPVTEFGRSYSPGAGGWRTGVNGMRALSRAARLLPTGGTLSYRKNWDDFAALETTNFWDDVSGGITSRSDPKVYVVQTSTRVVERCVLMTTNPGDLVLDPTCGAGTTAMVAEQWARRWITVDTSRVALALARARLMGARFPYFVLADSLEGRRKLAELNGVPTDDTSHPGGNLRHGLVCERLPRVTLKSIAQNSQIDVIWEQWQAEIVSSLRKLNECLGKNWEEWEVPTDGDESWSDSARAAHIEWTESRVGRQREIDAAIARNAEFESLVDRPFEDGTKVRVSGPFTVESVSPHRTLIVGPSDELVDPLEQIPDRDSAGQDFGTMVLDNLRTAGIQQSQKDDRIEFSSVVPWPGSDVCAEGRYIEGGDPDDAESGDERRAAIFIGPEFGTVTRPQLVGAAREAAEAGFDVLVACAFSYDAQVSDLLKMGQLQILKARMNADLHMANDLKNTGRGNLFVVFGEPDIELESIGDADADRDLFQVKINGVDIFDPATGKIRSDDTNGIACWFIDTDYNEESFFVRHAYFPGTTNDPYKALKTSLKTEVDKEAWETLNSDVSRPFDKPESGRIAIKVINHLGDEAMKIVRVD